MAIEITEMAGELSEAIVVQGASVDTVAICGMLKLLIAQLGVLTVAMAEKKCQR
jgi:hypothetical protein